MGGEIRAVSDDEAEQAADQAYIDGINMYDLKMFDRLILSI